MKPALLALKLVVMTLVLGCAPCFKTASATHARVSDVFPGLQISFDRDLDASRGASNWQTMQMNAQEAVGAVGWSPDLLSKIQRHRPAIVCEGGQHPLQAGGC